MTSRLLIVEDEPGLVRTLSDRLEREGFEVCSAGDGREGSLRLARERFDLVVLDLMLPHKSGLEICRELRAGGDRTLVLMLTARTAVVDRVAGLEGGADDYLPKPFEMSELVARVRALLRRATGGEPSSDLESEVRFGAFVLDLQERELRREGAIVDLSARGAQLLCYLVARRGVSVSRHELLRDVWGYRGRPRTRTVDVHIAQLRKVIENDPRRPRHIVTVQGEGYRFLGE